MLKPGGRVSALAAWAAPEENLWSVLPHREMIERGVVEGGRPRLANQFTSARRG